MRIWFDTEFIENGKTIDPISIGMVSAIGTTYYAEFLECNLETAGSWVKKHVIPLLSGNKKSRLVIAGEIQRFAGNSPEFWAYFADYDWVLLCQLYGSMMNLPEGWPKFCLDIKQSIYERGDYSVQRPEGGDHNALNDALWNKRVWESIYLKERKVA